MLRVPGPFIEQVKRCGNITERRIWQGEQQCQPDPVRIAFVLSEILFYPVIYFGKLGWDCFLKES